MHRSSRFSGPVFDDDIGDRPFHVADPAAHHPDAVPAILKKIRKSDGPKPHTHAAAVPSTDNVIRWTAGVETPAGMVLISVDTD
jgi:hypothetical protein